MCRILATLAIAASTIVLTCQGQGLPDEINFLKSNSEGVHIYGVSTYFAYSAFDFPPAGAANFQRKNYGASGTVGWQRFHGRTSISTHYSGSYSGDIGTSGLNHLNHSLVFDLSRELGRKWTVNLSASGQDSFLAQSIFEPSTLGALSQTPSTTDDLAAAMSVGRFSNTQNGLALNGSPSGYAPTLAALLGSHMLIYGLQASVSYEYSSRLSFQFGSFAAGGQHRVSDQTAGVSDNNAIPRSLGSTASASLTYSLSPRTDVGVSVSETYMRTRFQKAYLTSANGSLARKMGKSWFLRAFGGESLTSNAQQTSGAPPMRQTIYGASIGVKQRAHTLVASYNRSGYDVSTASIGENTILSGAWNWSHPRRSWALHASYSRHETKNTGFSTLVGWQGSAGISQRLKTNLTLLVNCSYLRSRWIYLSNTSLVNVDGIRVSLGWTPQLRRHSADVSDTEEEVK